VEELSAGKSGKEPAQPLFFTIPDEKEEGKKEENLRRKKKDNEDQNTLYHSNLRYLAIPQENGTLDRGERKKEKKEKLPFRGRQRT